MTEMFLGAYAPTVEIPALLRTRNVFVFLLILPLRRLGTSSN